MTSKRKVKNFRFHRPALVGAVDAEQDQFLEECFLDKGDLEIVRDLNDHRCVIVGRTGSGKSALIRRLRETAREKVIALDPHELSLSFISNNTVLKTLEDSGINLVPFYRLLWKHIFATEIIRRHYRITNQATNDAFFRQLSNIIRRDKAKEEAIAYFHEFGDKYWQTTEYRVQEIVRKITKQVEHSAGGKLTLNAPGIEGTAELSGKRQSDVGEEQKGEFVYHGQRVIQEIQIAKLSRVIDLLDSQILTDSQRQYYLTIDQLDESWAEEPIRYHLIFELLTVAYEINKKLSGRVKVIIALREDLIKRVYSFIRQKQTHHFQQEKYEDGYLRLSWNPIELKSVVRKRVEYLHSKGFTSQQVTLEDLFSNRVVLGSPFERAKGGYAPIDYIVDRTMLTPREMIRFFNRCIESARASDTGAFTKTVILNAERLYSQDRLDGLVDEWRINYPSLPVVFDLLCEQPSKFRLDDNAAQLQPKVDAIFDRLQFPDCPIANIMNRMYDPASPQFVELLGDLFYILFLVGAVGIERHNNSHVYWSFKEHRVLSSHFREHTSMMHIHPSLYYALSVTG